MTDLATIKAAAEAPAGTPLVARLQGFIRELLAMLDPLHTELPEQPDEPSRAQIEADWTAFNGATFYRFDADAEAIKEGLKEVRRRSG